MEADGQAEVITGVRKAIEEILEIVVTLATRAASSANKSSLRRTWLTLVFDLSRARLKNLPSVRERRKIPAFVVLKVCLGSTEKTIPKRVEANTALFESPANVECLRHVAIESNGTMHVALERLQKALRLWWAADKRQDLEETISVNQIKSLS